MCGIAGMISTVSREVAFQDVFTSLYHRGPDGGNALITNRNQTLFLSREESPKKAEAHSFLLHQRLAILDLSPSGQQPMTFDQENWITFNGEIYNFLEIREQLKAKGHRFRTESDTEVLLAGYKEWQENIVEKLTGMFAFTIFNPRTGKAFIARDPFGIKPFYYYYDNKTFVFASEIPTLLKIFPIEKKTNPERIQDYLRYGISEDNSTTFFEKIQQLPPGHYGHLEVEKQVNLRTNCYWVPTLTQKSFQLSFEEAAAKLQSIFFQNIDLHLRSDVSIGSCLSGGVDSSAIVCAMARKLSPNPIHTFSFIANDPKISEEVWIDEINLKTRATAHKIHISESQLFEDLDEFSSYQGEPTGSSSTFAQYCVFRKAKEVGIKVILDGQGADEIFGGYSFFYGARLASLLKEKRWAEAISFFKVCSHLPGITPLLLTKLLAANMVPAKVQKIIRRYIINDLQPNWMDSNWFREKSVDPRVAHYVAGEDTFRKMLLKSIQELTLPHLLRYEDRNSMRFSIESRVPFLTTSLVDFVFGLPEAYLLSNQGVTKNVFRKAMEPIVPLNVLYRKNKIGFETPESIWLRRNQSFLQEKKKQILKAEFPFLNRKEVIAGFNSFAHGKSPKLPIWRLISLSDWTITHGATF